jgi:hypothetical protein
MNRTVFWRGVVALHLLLAYIAGAAPSVVLPGTTKVARGKTLTIPATIQSVDAYPIIQWKKDNTDLGYGNLTTFTKTSAADSDAGVYTVTVSDSSGTVTSSATTVSVGDPVAIITHPVPSQTVLTGGMASMTVVASGPGVLTYQWYKDGIAVPNATNATLTITSVKARDAGLYAVYVGSEYQQGDDRAFSFSSILSVRSPPEIVTQPTNVTAIIGSSAELSVLAAGDQPMTYRWKKAGMPLIDGPIYSGGAQSSLLVKTVSSAEAGEYTVTVSNQYGSVTSSPATLVAITDPNVPNIIKQPSDVTVQIGDVLNISVVANSPDGSALSYQWLKDGTALPGYSSATLLVSDVQLVHSGGYVVVVTNGHGSVTSATANVVVGNGTRAVNLSSRAQVGIDGDILITGFVINGSTSKRMLIRAVGPGLIKLGVDGVLANPFVTLMSSSQEQLAANDDWGVSSNLQELTTAQSKVGAFPLDANSKDAALLVTLQPGAYTALVSGVSRGTGVALAEVYEVDDSTTNRLINLSARAYVGTGSKILIGGIVVRGNAPKRFLLRGVGPGLSRFGVVGLLADPKLSLMDRDGKAIAVNDDWYTNANAADIRAAMKSAGAFDIGGNTKDSALLVDLQPGTYTAIVEGVGNTSGVALVEVYEVQ